MQMLIDGLDAALKYAITVEEGRDFSTITNYEEERDKVKACLEEIRDNPFRMEVPLIYHLDVAAMYPNIILTNRLQPMAMVDEATCAACEFNRPGSNCQREMDWSWRASDRMHTSLVTSLSFAPVALVTSLPLSWLCLVYYSIALSLSFRLLWSAVTSVFTHRSATLSGVHEDVVD
jgi:DNA polymerase elongation subunit (family B)